MNLINNLKRAIPAFGLLYCIAALFTGCSPAGGNNTGHEYMQDMGHSVGFEANSVVLTNWNRWDIKGYHTLAQPRAPIAGTVARGFAGISNYIGRDLPPGLKTAFETEAINGDVPFYYQNTELERTRASNEIKLNPFPITKTGLLKGKDLYNIYCGICHGEKGDGNGFLVRDDGKYPAQPANLLSDDLINSNNGRYYFAIIYGRNMMGAYGDKLGYEERWNVIQYIRSLQAVSKGKRYDESMNTFNTTDRLVSVMGSAPDTVSIRKETTIIKAGKTVDSTMIRQ